MLPSPTSKLLAKLAANSAISTSTFSCETTQTKVRAHTLHTQMPACGGRQRHTASHALRMHAAVFELNVFLPAAADFPAWAVGQHVLVHGAPRESPTSQVRAAGAARPSRALLPDLQERVALRPSDTWLRPLQLKRLWRVPAVESTRLSVPEAWIDGRLRCVASPKWPRVHHFPVCVQALRRSWRSVIVCGLGAR